MPPSHLVSLCDAFKQIYNGNTSPKQLWQMDPAEDGWLTLRPRSSIPLKNPHKPAILTTHINHPTSFCQRHYPGRAWHTTDLFVFRQSINHSMRKPCQTINYGRDVSDAPQTGTNSFLTLLTVDSWKNHLNRLVTSIEPSTKETSKEQHYKILPSL